MNGVNECDRVQLDRFVAKGNNVNSSSENDPPEEQPEEQPEFETLPTSASAAGSGRLRGPSASGRSALKPTKRAGAPTSSRRNPADNTANAKAAVPPPDKAKTIAFAVCGLLIVGIIGMGGYLVLRPKTATGAKAPLERLAGDAKALAEKALKADALYNEGIEKSATKTLESLHEADEKLTEANLLFNEIVDSNQTVEGFKEKIDLARDRKMSIDKQLRPIRVKIEELETEVRRAKMNAAATVKAPDAPATPVTPAPGEPALDLSDANLNRLFKDDPSEYERLAKIRKAKDPSFVIRKEE